MIPAPQVARLSRAMPFWMSLLLIPVTILGALHGGWTVILLPVMTSDPYSGSSIRKVCKCPRMATLANPTCNSL